MKKHGLFAIFSVLLMLSSISTAFGDSDKCTPTGPDALGPFYKPNAPVRSKVGEGYVLSGVVKSSRDYSVIANAMLEFWIVGPDGNYDDDHRAIVFSNKTGAYSFESEVPQPYAGRPPHIHIKISAKGFKTLVTQHYPARRETKASFDIVLVPSQ